MNEKQRTTIQCDKCSYQFFVNEVDIESQKVDRFDVQFFRCPRCKRAYPIVICDTPQKKFLLQIRAIQNEIDSRRKLNKPISPAKIRQLNRLFAESKDHQAILRNTYLQAVTDQLNKSDNETSSVTGKEEES